MNDELQNTDFWVNICLTFTNDPVLAKDLWQEVVCDLWNKNQSNAKGYIYRTIYLKWNDKHQRFKNKFLTRYSIDDYIIPEKEDVIDLTDEHMKRLVSSALDNYDDLDAALLECHANGMSLRDMAEKIGCHYSTLSYRIKKTKDDIKRNL